MAERRRSGRAKTVRQSEDRQLGRRQATGAKAGNWGEGSPASNRDPAVPQQQSGRQPRLGSNRGYHGHHGEGDQATM